MNGTKPEDEATPSVPPVSRASRPRFATRERRDELAKAYEAGGAQYEQLRPGYPAAVVDRMLAAAGAREGDTAIDLGAGTGKLSRALAARGMNVTAVDPSAAMLDVAAQTRDGGGSPRRGSVTLHEGTAEHTGLPAHGARLVTAAQAWHWFDAEAATREVLRLLTPGTADRPPGVLALVWNTLDVSIPWVHRYSRIAHAGDVLREDFTPATGPGLSMIDRLSLRWEDHRTTDELVNLARTRSYVITATEDRRRRVLENLDWYLHDHLGHTPGTSVPMVYRCDLVLYTTKLSYGTVVQG